MYYYKTFILHLFSKKMKRRHIVLFIAFLFLNVIYTYADDIIVFRNGDIVNSSVIEITTSDIKYKKSSNLNGPIYSVSKTDILSIKYENGETEKFDINSKTNNNKNFNEPILALPDEDNALQKANYSIGNYSSTKDISSKQAKSASFFLKFTQASIISSIDLNVKFEPGYCFEGKWYPYNSKIPSAIVKRIANIQYRIHIMNKTNKDIYIDLGKTSKFDEINGFITYYDGSQVINSTTDLSGGTVNLGLVTIGGGSSESATIVQKGKRIKW